LGRTDLENGTRVGPKYMDEGVGRDKYVGRCKRVTVGAKYIAGQMCRDDECIGAGQMSMSWPYFAESFAGSNLAEFDPAKIPASLPTMKPETLRLEVVKKRDCGTEGRFGHQAVGSQRTHELHV